MNATVTKTIELYGIEFQIAVDFDYSETTSREPFEHFGNRGSRKETEISFDGFDGGVYIKGALPESVSRELAREIEDRVEMLNPSDWWDENDCLKVVE